MPDSGKYPGVAFLTAVRRLPGESIPLVALSRAAPLYALFLLIVGCASYGPIDNQPAKEAAPERSYSLSAYHKRVERGEQTIMLAFSGGGTRAAALSYGVLKALRDTRVETDGGEISLLDEVGSISSVSGGSFTSAYYGLYGDAIFESFESEFLKKNVQGNLLHKLMNPFNWFHISNRTEWAINYYEEHIFKGATYADLLAADGPLVVINASDLTAGTGFSFVQEYFDLLCSDILSFPISRAVAASSAVPGLFSPVVLENYDGCTRQHSGGMESVRALAAGQPQLETVERGLESYSDKERKRYLHLVDGGITDNLGLRGTYNVTKFTGGIANYYKRFDREPPRRIVIIALDAATQPDYAMSRSNRIPPISEVVGAMSGAQMHNYNADTIALMQETIRQWAKELSTPERKVDSYLIEMNLQQVVDPTRREFLNGIPTSFSLTDEEVDALIETGGSLLRDHPVFQALMADFESSP